VDLIDYKTKTKKVKVDLTNSQNMWTITDKKPQIEKDLTEVQRKYFKEKDPAKKHILWQEMFSLVQKYGRSLILKKKKGGRFVDPETIEDQSIQVALAFMSQYIYRPDFHVEVSFAGMMNGKVLETLYKQLPDDDNESINETMGDSTNEFEDIQDTAMESVFREMPLPEDALNRVSITKIMYDLFEEFDEQVTDLKIKLKLRFYIFILLRKPRNKHIFPTFLKYQCNKQELDLIQLFELTLYERLKDGIS
jgi:hypothetical protein